MMWRTNSDEPRATITSTMPCRPSTAATSSRPSSSTAARRSMPAASSTLWMTAASARLVPSASRPPLSSTALPLFHASPTICTSASGRDSNTTPSNPSGALTRSSTRPSSSSRRSVARPTRSGIAASWSSPSHTPSSFAGVQAQALHQRRRDVLRLGALQIGGVGGGQLGAHARLAQRRGQRAQQRRAPVGAQPRQLAARRLGGQRGRAHRVRCLAADFVAASLLLVVIRRLPSPGCRA